MKSVCVVSVYTRTLCMLMLLSRWPVMY